MLDEQDDDLNPPRPALGPPLDKPMDKVLARLEAALAAHAPDVLASLAPGLSRPEIERLQEQSGVRLSEELQLLHMWRNGSSSPSAPFLGMFYWDPLQDLIATVAQDRALDPVDPESDPAAYMSEWIVVFRDGGGLNYFYDPSDADYPDNIFLHDPEMGNYAYFPALRNLLAAAADCYEQGLYLKLRRAAAASDLDRVLAALEEERQVHRQYGAVEVPEAE